MTFKNNIASKDKLIGKKIYKFMLLIKKYIFFQENGGGMALIGNIVIENLENFTFINNTA